MTSLHPVLSALESSQLHATDFFVTLLTHPAYQNHSMVNDLVTNAETIIKTFMQHPVIHSKIIDQCFHIVEETYLREIRNLAAGDSGSHFGAANATVQQLEEFCIDGMAHTMETRAPRLWNMLESLLQEKQQRQGLGESRSMENIDQDDEDQPSDTADFVWNEINEIDLEGVIEQITASGSNRPSSAEERRSKRRSAMRAMVSHHE
ncbi:hypothetical protein JVT61DRAFT_11250 [Boletus reticuloceps]|uniref:Uncharacterized protein n=1 Tax=Boletus reticuloceps TaxID=495285 RepID=A0A8I2YEQ7_9AGAM|nr:hypothetical protein JVT61DRAFT_11250 [Boletus reticuloceps]